MALMVRRAVAVEEFTRFVRRCQVEWYFFGLGNKEKAGAYPKCRICSCVGARNVGFSVICIMRDCAHGFEEETVEREERAD